METRGSIRATIDTNLLISAALYSGRIPGRLFDGLYLRRFVMVTSDAQITELTDVIHRPKFATGYGLTDARRVAILKLVADLAVFVEPTAIPPGTVRDYKDEAIIGTAIAGSADVIISGDKDILVLKGHSILGAINIMTAAEFIANLEL